MSIEKARSARRDKVLDRKRRWADGVVASLRERVDSGCFESAESAMVPKVEFNRRKYNRMGWDEQAEYDRKRKEKKAEYRLYWVGKDGVFAVVPKTAYDYYMEVT